MAGEGPRADAPAIPVYARHASAAFNARLDGTLRALTAEVKACLGDALTALVLGGGYGRGEGGIVRRDGAEAPYNDLDLTLVVRERRGLPLDALDAIRRGYERLLGIEVDFSRPLTLEDIRRWPPWLMWFDLLHGHIVLAGPPDVLAANAPPALQEPPAPIEATRLLLNRGAGLLWAMRVVAGVEAPPDDDFVRRNYYKCALALGDALLLAHRRFATPYAGRDGRLARLAAEVPAVAAVAPGPLYAAALGFKFRPDDAPALPLDAAALAALAGQWGAVFLHVERERTGAAWVDLGGYAAWRGLREPEQHAGRRLLRNLVQNGRRGVWSWRYPREALYRELPVLLGSAGPRPADWAARSAGFLAVWRRFN